MDPIELKTLARNNLRELLTDQLDAIEAHNEALAEADDAQRSEIVHDIIEWQCALEHEVDDAADAGFVLNIADIIAFDVDYVVSQEGHVDDLCRLYHRCLALMKPL